MKLYFHPISSNSRKPRLVAHELDIALELQLVNVLAGEQRNTEFLAINPNGKVPVLQDGDFTLWESNAIAQYLCSKRPGNALWPNDERTRADISRWQCWELAHWMPPIGALGFERMIKRALGMGDADAAEIKKQEEKFHIVARVLDQHLAKRDYLVGKVLTLADISVSADLMYTPAAQLPLDKYPNIKRWFARIENLPAWQKTAPPAA